MRHKIITLFYFYKRVDPPGQIGLMVIFNNVDTRLQLREGVDTQKARGLSLWYNDRIVCYLAAGHEKPGAAGIYTDSRARKKSNAIPCEIWLKPYLIILYPSVKTDGSECNIW